MESVNSMECLSTVIAFYKGLNDHVNKKTEHKGQDMTFYFEARFMGNLPVWPLRSWSHKCTQNEIQSLYLHS